MDSCVGCRASQAKALLCSFWNSYYVPVPSSSIHNDSSRARPQRASLPLMQAERATNAMNIMDCIAKSNDSFKPTAITQPMRKSVTGMKRPLPLKLCSPPLPEEHWPSPASICRSTFGLLEVTNDDDTTSRSVTTQGLGESEQHPLIRPGQYRDTPVYTEPGSPLFGRAYYTDQDVCFSCSPPGSSCNEACIIHEYESLNEESDSDGEAWFTDGFDEEPSVVTPKQIKSQDDSRRSDLSFQCMGEDRPFRNCLFPDEAAWLSSSRENSPRSKSLPQIPADMPVDYEADGWLSDSSSCCEDESDVFACATALAPAKAHVVSVNTSSRMSIKIPPRSSSLSGTRPRSLTPDSVRERRMSFHLNPGDSAFSGSWSAGDETTPKQHWFKRSIEADFTGRHMDLAMSSPPTTPMQFSGWPASQKSLPAARPSQIPVPTVRPTDPYRITSFQTYTETLVDQSEQALVPNDSIMVAIEDFTSKFPSSMLLPETPWIIAIRHQLHKYSTAIPRIPPTTSHPLPLSSHNISLLTPNFASRPRTSTYPPSSLPRPSTTYTSSPIPPPTHHAYFTSTLPNLTALHQIFPASTPFLRSALYAHIVAYIYLTTIPFPSSYSSTRFNTAHATPSHHKFLPQNRLNHSKSSLNFSHPNLPLNTPTSGQSQRLPVKAAMVLGMPLFAELPPCPPSTAIESNEENERDKEKEKRAELTRKIEGCIFWLVGEMEGPDAHRGRAGLDVKHDMVLLRALVVIVMGCECF